MSEFYARIKGNRGPATRMGHKTSGVQASVQSWKGSIVTRLDDVSGETHARIYFSVGSTFSGERLLWEGPLHALSSARRLLAVQREKED